MSEAVKFYLGDIVYHMTDDEPGIVTAIVHRPNHVNYEITWQNREVQEHSEIEISKEQSKSFWDRLTGGRDE